MRGVPASARKILVLDAECNAATCVVQSLGRAGHSIVLGGMSETAFSFHSRYVNRTLVYPSPLKSRQAFLSWISGLLASESFDYVLPLSDVTLYPLRDLDPRPSGLILPADESFEWFFDKAKTLELAERCGVPIPRTRLFSPGDRLDLRSLSEFPYFVKLTRSKTWLGDRGYDLEARLARDPAELSEAVSGLMPYGPVLVQSYEPGEGVGVELLCDRGQVLLSFAHQRIHEYPLTGGGSTYRVSIPVPPDLLSASERLVREAGWTGVAMVEFKKADERFSLMEVNGRFWGSLPLSYRSGVDFPRSLVDLLEGRPPKASVPYRTGIRSRRFSTDFSWFKRNLVADKRDPYVKTRPLGKTLMEYGGFLTGRDHWDHGALSDPKPLLKEIGQTLSKNASDILHRGKGLLVRKAVPFQSRKKLGRILKNGDFQGRPLHILVVCYGNICRSPFVERLLKSSLDPARVEVQSCGFIEREGRQSPEDYLFAVLEAGIDLSSHRSTAITGESVRWADLILLMDYRNWKMLQDFAPEAESKSLWLGAFGSSGSGEIPDPYGKEPEEMRSIIGAMAEAAARITAEISTSLPGTPTASSQDADRPKGLSAKSSLAGGH